MNFESKDSQSNSFENLSTSLGHVLNMLSYTEAEKARYDEKGSSLNFMVKELYRNMVLEIWGIKFDISYPELIKILELPLPFMLNEFGKRGVNEQDLVNSLAEGFKFWGDTDLSQNIINNLFTHLQGQIEKMLGELVLTNGDILKDFVSDKNKRALEALYKSESFQKYLEKDSVRQTIFKYNLPDSFLPKQIVSALIAENLKKSAEREVVERHNLQDIERISPQTKEGEVLVEVSPPFYTNFQKYLMIRVYKRTSGGWDINQYSIPYDSNEVKVALENLSNNGKNLLVNDSLKFKSIENQQLRQLLKFPAGTDIYKTILSNFSHIQEHNNTMEILSEVIGKVIRKLMIDMSLSINDLLINLPNLANPQMFEAAIKQLNLVLVSADIALADNVTANELFENSKGQISRKDLVAKTSSSEYNLEKGIHEKTTAGSYEKDTECSSLTIEKAEGPKGTGEHSKISGLEISRTFKQGDFKLNVVIKDGKEYFENCPVCARPLIDVCESNCPNPNCKISFATLAKAYSDGNIEELISEKKEGLSGKQKSIDIKPINYYSRKPQVQESQIFENFFGGIMKAILPYKTEPEFMEQ